MKTITKFILVMAAAAVVSCEGIPGPPGPPGADGETFIGSIFEIQGDFTAQNDYQIFFDFPSDFEVYDSDVVLVYILWEQTTSNNGNPLDVWRLLPQTVVIQDGVLQYNFDYTLLDVKVFLEGTIDFSTLLPAEWKDQVFRIAVLPADFAKKGSVDISDLNSMLKSPELKLNRLERVDFSGNITETD